MVGENNPCDSSSSSSSTSKNIAESLETKLNIEHGDPSDSSCTPIRRQRLKRGLLYFSILFPPIIIGLVLVIKICPGYRTTSYSHKGRASILLACSQTRFPNLCLNSFFDFPDALTINSYADADHISLNLTSYTLGYALYGLSQLNDFEMDAYLRSAYDDCLELLDHSVDLLSRSLASVTSRNTTQDDVLTWISAALTNQDTCAQAFRELKRNGVKNLILDRLENLPQLVSNSLAIYASKYNVDDHLAAAPPRRGRKLLREQNNFPSWMTRRDRILLQVPVSAINPDFIVSKDGNGTHKTIADAIKEAPKYSKRRFIIYVRAGRYEEDMLRVSRKKINIMVIGDGKDKTIISGAKSVQDNMTSFHTATFAATGDGFFARDLTFENTAGPSKHQAVALRIGADHAVAYRCNIIGYQETLHAHSQRQFYRECDIYGTLDFISGNAAAVFQNCTIHTRKSSITSQTNIITAQTRIDPNQNTGFSIHACTLVADEPNHLHETMNHTYLGCPRTLFSRTVFMLSYIGDHVHPRGWLEWNAKFTHDTLYYGEYMNYGPGAATWQRVKWSGYRTITSMEEASKFTVAQFIQGWSWLPSTGVAFLAGLST